MGGKLVALVLLASATAFDILAQASFILSWDEELEGEDAEEDDETEEDAEDEGLEQKDAEE